MGINETFKEKNTITVPVQHERGCDIDVISLELTFAGLQAVKPPVINVSVPGTATVLIPRTTRSTATHSAGFLERAALWARHRLSDR